MSRSRYGLLVGVLTLSSVLIAQETRLLSQALGSAEKDEKTVLIMQTSLGEIQLELNAEKAPITVKNFLQYVDDKFYDGTVFHRVIPGFMIQGGGMTPGLKEKKTRDPIKNEATNGLKNERGTLAMARTPVVDSATAQFFISVKNNVNLNHRDKTPDDYGYCVFGKVIKGMDVVDKIVSVKTHRVGRNDDVPVEDIVIQSVRREKKKEE